MLDLLTLVTILVMIFDRDKVLNVFYAGFIIHVFIFLSISLNILSPISFADFTLLTCLIIYLSNGSNIKWYQSLLIFLWGIYSDLLIGYPIGYSSAIFLFFLLLNQASNFFGIFFIDSIRFLIFVIGLAFVAALEYLAIYLQFSTTIAIYLQLLEILFILIFYYSINYLLKNILNFYATKE